MIDLVEERTDPVPHTFMHGHFMHGHFSGTDARFAFYFAPPEHYEGRFILGPTHQLTTNENGRDPRFAFSSGAYLVATNLGGIENPLQPLPIGAADTTIRGYRVNTEAARFSRQKANEVYAASHAKHRPYGYIYGGSGGSYMTICTLQQTSGIFDGGVPFISANHMATPYTYTVRILALRLIRYTGVNRFFDVMDAIDPGGSGDPLATLNPEQAQAFQEATRFGFPPRGWWSHATMTAGALPLVASEVPIEDPTYTDDFWNVPGYAGFDDPCGTLAGARLQDPPGARTVVANLGFGLLLDSAPPASQAAGADLIVDTGAAAGRRWQLVALPGGNLVIPFVGFGSPPFSPPGCMATGTCISAGDKVHVDNPAVIALQYYNRHQDPNGDPEYDILTQIGFVVLVGLACKNAILIVEFARAREDEGMSPAEAAIEACRLRLRPILMTSFAFILGVVPLVVSSGVGAEMRRALGTAVFSGMIGVPLFGLLLTPVFYVSVRWLVARLRGPDAG